MVRVHGVITDRDLEFLSWVGRFRGVTSAQVAQWFLPDAADGPRVIDRRMRVFREHGLVTSQRVLASYPSVHTLTRSGMTRVDLFGSVKRPHVGQFVHDLAVTDLLVWLRSRDHGLRCLTEREVRAIDVPSCDEPKYAVRALEGSSRKLIYPDLITISSKGEPMAHEVEASPKDANRLRLLMLAYAANPARRMPVTYYAKPSLQRRLDHAFKDARDHASQWSNRRDVPVTITGWDWVGEAA